MTMTMTDLMNTEQWKAFEQEFNRVSGLNACAYDNKGMTFTGFKAWANEICPLVKSTPEGIQAICSVAHQNMSAKARETKATVIGQCDAGLTKICTPVFVDGEFVGIVGGCGLLLDDDEVETFAVHKATGKDEGTVAALVGTVKRFTDQDARELAVYLENKVREIVSRL